MLDVFDMCGIPLLLALGHLLAFSDAFRIATHNLRFDSMPNNITVQQSVAALPDPLVQPKFLGLSGEQPWSTRRLKIAEHILSEGVILLGALLSLLR